MYTHVHNYCYYYLLPHQLYIVKELYKINAINLTILKCIID